MARHPPSPPGPGEMRAAWGSQPRRVREAPSGLLVREPSPPSPGGAWAHALWPGRAASLTCLRFSFASFMAPGCEGNACLLAEGEACSGPTAPVRSSARPGPLGSSEMLPGEGRAKGWVCYGDGTALGKGDPCAAGRKAPTWGDGVPSPGSPSAQPRQTQTRGHRVSTLSLGCSPGPWPAAQPGPLWPPIRSPRAGTVAKGEVGVGGVEVQTEG